jgi:hypothetical protein
MEKKEMTIDSEKKRKQKRFNIPVIGHFADKSIRFHSIIEAEHITGITYTLIFEACVGKIYKARNVYWEFENGAHYIHYKAFYVRYLNQIRLEEDNEERIKHEHEYEHSHPKKIAAKHH